MPVTDELEKEQKTVLVDASSFILNSALAYENCLDLARATKARMAIVDDLLGPAVNAAHKAPKARYPHGMSSSDASPRKNVSG
jgi:hypothetical protein